MNSATQTKTETIIYPCDPELREQLRALRAAGELSNSKLARSCKGVSDTAISFYLSDDGNRYSGDTARLERQFRAWLERRDMNRLGGIPTIKTGISSQIERFALMLRRARRMGKLIGTAGIGKTRGITLLRDTDPTVIVIFVSGETGTREGIRSALFRELNIRGPRKRTSSRRRVMYQELCKKLREADTLLAFDQAHRLSLPAMDFLTELWNDTSSPQLWLGTDELDAKVERDEQIASRVAFTDFLSLAVPEGADEEFKKEIANEIRALVKHQVQSRLPELNGETNAVLKACEKLAANGSFRRVENHLIGMLYLSESPINKSRPWIELFDQAGSFLTED